MNTLEKALAVAVTALSFATGCSAPAPPEDGDRSAIQTALAEEVHFELEPSSSEIVILADGRWFDAADEIELVLSGGSATLSANEEGMVVVSALQLSFEDLAVAGDPGSLLSEVDSLSNLTVELERGASAGTAWDAQGAHGTGELSLTVGWALGVGDADLELSDHTIRGLPFAVDVVDDDNGELRLSVQTSAEGNLWSIPPVLELLRLDMSLEGRTQP